MRRYVTLLELVIVIALIGLVGGVLGIRIAKGSREHRFRAAIDGIASRLDLAQELMLCFETDVTVRLSRHGDKLRVELDADGTDLRGLTHLSRPTEFTGIIDWEPKDDLEFFFHRTPQFEAQDLHFIGHGQEEWLHLKWFPSPVARGPSQEAPLEPTPFPEEMLPAAGDPHRVFSCDALRRAASPSPYCAGNGLPEALCGAPIGTGGVPGDAAGATDVV